MPLRVIFSSNNYTYFQLKLYKGALSELKHVKNETYTTSTIAFSLDLMFSRATCLLEPMTLCMILFSNWYVHVELLLEVIPKTFQRNGNINGNSWFQYHITLYFTKWTNSVCYTLLVNIRNTEQSCRVPWTHKPQHLWS